MDIDSMRSFIELGQCASMTEAARRLNLTQPTLSKRIKVMERELGATLLDRSSHATRLTLAGSAFMNASIDIVNRYDDVGNELRWLAKRPVVNVGGMLHDGDVKHLIETIGGKHASYALSCNNGRLDLTFDPLRSGDLGALFAPLDSSLPIFGDKAFCVRLFKSEQSFAAMGSGNEFASAEKLSLVDLRGQTFIRLVQGQSTDDGWKAIEQACIASGFTPKRRFLEIDGGRLDIGDDVYIMPESKIADARLCLAPGTTSIVPIEDGIRWNPCLITLKNPRNKAVAAFEQDVDNYLAALEDTRKVAAGSS